MALPITAVISVLFALYLSFSVPVIASRKLPTTDPIPTPWPEQFHSILFMETNGTLQMSDLWYDWPNGRNFNIIQNQLGKLLYDLEWNNGTSFYYTLDSNKECRVLHFPVGILTPNWLHGANYTGQKYVDKFLCNVWEKVDFITYYEDVVSKRPVFWAFYTGMNIHVMTFEVGKVLDDPNWQAPVYCFNKAVDDKQKEENKSLISLESLATTDGLHNGNFMRQLPLVMNLSMVV